MPGDGGYPQSSLAREGLVMAFSQSLVFGCQYQGAPGQDEAICGPYGGDRGEMRAAAAAGAPRGSVPKLCGAFQQSPHRDGATSLGTVLPLFYLDVDHRRAAAYGRIVVWFYTSKETGYGTETQSRSYEQARRERGQQGVAEPVILEGCQDGGGFGADATAWSGQEK